MFNSRKTDYSVSNDNNTIEALKKMFRGGVDRQFGIQRCKLVYIELTDNKVLIYGSGNYIQYPVINHTHIYMYTHTRIWGFPGSTSGKELACQCRRRKKHRFDSWIGKIPWRRERLPTPVFWPGEFHGLYSPWGLKESDTTERLSLKWKKNLGQNYIFEHECLKDTHL